MTRIHVHGNLKPDALALLHLIHTDNGGAATVVEVSDDTLEMVRAMESRGLVEILDILTPDETISL